MLKGDKVSEFDLDKGLQDDSDDQASAESEESDGERAFTVVFIVDVSDIFFQIKNDLTDRMEFMIKSPDKAHSVAEEAKRNKIVMN